MTTTTTATTTTTTQWEPWKICPLFVVEVAVSSSTTIGDPSRNRSLVDGCRCWYQQLPHWQEFVASQRGACGCCSSCYSCCCCFGNQLTYHGNNNHKNNHKDNNHNVIEETNKTTGDLVVPKEWAFLEIDDDDDSVRSRMKLVIFMCFQLATMAKRDDHYKDVLEQAKRQYAMDPSAAPEPDLDHDAWPTIVLGDPSVRQMIRTAWNCLSSHYQQQHDQHHVLSEQDWMTLLHYVYPRMHVVSEVEHPLSVYVTQYLPQWLSSSSSSSSSFAHHLETVQELIQSNLALHPGRHYTWHPKDASATNTLTAATTTTIISTTTTTTSTTPTISVLPLIQLVQEYFPPRRFGVLWHPDRPDGNHRLPPHSCAPNAQLELSGPPHHHHPHHHDPPVVSLTSWHRRSTAPADAQITFLHCLQASVEQREAALQRRTGHSCACSRCRIEAGSLAVSQLDYDTAWTLARYYLSTCGSLSSTSSSSSSSSLSSNVTWAETLLDHVLQQCPHHAEAWHARGALALMVRGQFLQAQRIWHAAQQACISQSRNQHDDNDEEEESHATTTTTTTTTKDSLIHCCAGLTLQWEKIQAYRYLEPCQPLSSSSMMTHCEQIQQGKKTMSALDSTVLVPGKLAFVTTQALIDPMVCQQIINWVEQDGEWTQQRHYAVPTHDVPVHTVPQLLDWFNQWFVTQMRPLLSHQFETSENYFVHDAFCVRYDGTLSSSYLPIHVDESTHSLVVALNDCDKDYTGGGTYFHDSSSQKSANHLIVRLHAGQVLSFRGDRLYHGGEAVLTGTRYILAVFLYHDDDHDHTGNNHKKGSDGGSDQNFNGPAEREQVGIKQKRRKANADDTQGVPSTSKMQRQAFAFGFNL